MTPTIHDDHPLARLATVRTGGNAEHFARAGSAGDLAELVAWAADGGHEVNVVGSGSNLLIADEGVRGLVIKLDRELAAIEPDGDTGLVCGGGARLPAVSAQAARLGLSGIEFGVNIPGTVGGAVRMNANAYGGELARTLRWVEIVDAGGVHRRGPDELGFAYRHSNLTAGEIVARAGFAPDEGRPVARQGDDRADAPPAPRRPAAGHQDVRLDVQEPRRPARRRAHRRAAAVGGGLQRPGGRAARSSPTSTRTSSRTPATRRPGRSSS